MNIVDRIKEIEKQISSLEKIIKKGEHDAAGIDIDLCVGARSNEHYSDLKLELCYNTGPILEAMMKGLRQSHKINMIMAQQELRALQDFIDSTEKK